MCRQSVQHWWWCKCLKCLYLSSTWSSFGREIWVVYGFSFYRCSEIGHVCKSYPNTNWHTSRSVSLFLILFTMLSKQTYTLIWYVLDERSTHKFRNMPNIIWCTSHSLCMFCRFLTFSLSSLHSEDISHASNHPGHPYSVWLVAAGWWEIGAHA